MTQSLYMKLHEIQKKLVYIQKTSEGHNFRYSDEKSILLIVRPMMDELKLMLKVDMHDSKIVQDRVVLTNMREYKYRKPVIQTEDYKDQDNLNRHITRQISDASETSLKECIWEVGFYFTWINVEKPEETLSSYIYLQHEGGKPQNCGSLLTYAYRYFLYKFFCVPTDEDSPEEVEKQKKKDEQNEVFSVEEYMDWIFDFCERNNLKPNDVQNYLKGFANHYNRPILNIGFEYKHREDKLIQKLKKG